MLPKGPMDLKFGRASQRSDRLKFGRAFQRSMDLNLDVLPKGPMDLWKVIFVPMCMGPLP